MAVGGGVSLSDRRPARSARPSPPRQPQRRHGAARNELCALACHSCVVVARCSVVLAGAPAFAVQPDEMLPDPPSLKPARATARAELRCMVCQNQSIDDSDAPLARDLRLLVRERLTAGDSDQQVLDFLVDRYGEFVLLQAAAFGWQRRAMPVARRRRGAAARRACGLLSRSASPRAIRTLPAIDRRYRLRLSRGAPCRTARRTIVPFHTRSAELVDLQTNRLRPTVQSLIPPTPRCKAACSIFRRTQRALQDARLTEVFGTELPMTAGRALPASRSSARAPPAGRRIADVAVTRVPSALPRLRLSPLVLHQLHLPRTLSQETSRRLRRGRSALPTSSTR